MAELVAVIAQRQRARQIAFERRELGEVADPLRIVQTAKAHRSGPALIAEAQPGIRKIGGLHFVTQPAC